MTRGDLVTVVLPGNLGEPRPALVVQADLFAAASNVVLCPLTSRVETSGTIRVRVEPAPANGLRRASAVMVDKLAAVRRERCGEVIGRLDPDALARVDVALLLILGLAG